MLQLLDYRNTRQLPMGAGYCQWVDLLTEMYVIYIMSIGPLAAEGDVILCGCTHRQNHRPLLWIPIEWVSQRRCKFDSLTMQWYLTPTSFECQLWYWWNDWLQLIFPIKNLCFPFRLTQTEWKTCKPPLTTVEQQNLAISRGRQFRDGKTSWVPTTSCYGTSFPLILTNLLTYILTYLLTYWKLLAGLAYRYRPIWYIGRYSQYRQNRYIGIGKHYWQYHEWACVRARISAEISVMTSISAYRLSVKFQRYANPSN